MIITSSLTLKTNPFHYSDDKSEIDNKLSRYCRDHCPGLPEQEMFDKITRGEHLEKLLADPGLTDEQLNQAASISSVVDLMWWFMAKAAYYNELHTQGCFRIDDPGLLLLKFLFKAGGERIYDRTSSHMQENLAKAQEKYGVINGLQYGLDIKKEEGPLPANMGTILFAMQPDGTLYLKLEEHGLPPFWRPYFCSFQNVYETLNHVADYYFPEKRQDQGYDLGQFKEHTPRYLKIKYSNVIKEILDSDPANEEQLLELERKGLQFGISKMHKILTNTLANSQVETKKKLVGELNRLISKAESRGYKGKIKGKEVVLPKLGSPISYSSIK